MKILILSVLVAVASAEGEGGYDLPRPSVGAGGTGGSIGIGGSIGVGGPISIGGHTGAGVSGGLGGALGPCSGGLVRDALGQCVQPEVTRQVYVYNAPEQEPSYGPVPEIPTPKVNYNVVFVHTPEAPEGADPIIVPPPQQKTLVYVLSKKGSNAGPKVIEVPAPPGQEPEVFFINYDEGDNPQLPGGISLQDALSSAAAQQGNVFGGVSGAGIGVGFGGVSGSGSGLGFGAGHAAGIGGLVSGGSVLGGLGGGSGGAVHGTGALPSPSSYYGTP